MVKHYYIIPALQSHDTEVVKAGEIEYQVSDGPAGNRSVSYDYATLEEAVKYCNEVNATYDIIETD